MNRAKRILLVEDNDNDAELTILALNKYNISNYVDRVYDGEDALDYIYCRGEFKTRSGGAPVVVLLDLKLPKVDGLEVLSQIKADEEKKIIPVVVLTSSCEERDIIESYKLGVNAYVVKPVDFNQFVDAVKKLSLFWVLINESPSGKV